MCLLEVVIQVSLSSIGLVATDCSAMVRLLASVKAQMCLEIAFLEEGAAAILEWADEVPTPIVLLDVDLQALNTTVR